MVLGLIGKMAVGAARFIPGIIKSPVKGVITNTGKVISSPVGKGIGKTLSTAGLVSTLAAPVFYGMQMEALQSRIDTLENQNKQVSPDALIKAMTDAGIPAAAAKALLALLNAPDTTDAEKTKIQNEFARIQKQYKFTKEQWDKAVANMQQATQQPSQPPTQPATAPTKKTPDVTPVDSADKAPATPTSSNKTNQSTLTAGTKPVKASGSTPANSTSAPSSPSTNSAAYKKAVDIVNDANKANTTEAQIKAAETLLVMLGKKEITEDEFQRLAGASSADTRAQLKTMKKAGTTGSAQSPTQPATTTEQADTQPAEATPTVKPTAKSGESEAINETTATEETATTPAENSNPARRNLPKQEADVTEAEQSDLGQLMTSYAQDASQIKPFLQGMTQLFQTAKQQQQLQTERSADGKTITYLAPNTTNSGVLAVETFVPIGNSWNSTVTYSQVVDGENDQLSLGKTVSYLTVDKQVRALDSSYQQKTPNTVEELQQLSQQIATTANNNQIEASKSLTTNVTSQG